MVATRLNATLGVSNLLQHRAIVFQVLREDILLLPDLRQQHAEFVGDVGDGVVARGFAPVGELGGDGDALAGGGLVSSDGVVLGFDDLEELFGEFGLLEPAKRCDCEAVFGGGGCGGCGAGGGGFGADGEGAVPVVEEGLVGSGFGGELGC